MEKQIIINMISMILCNVSAAFATDVSSRQAPLKAIPPYNWSAHFDITINDSGEPGNQVLHSKSLNKPYTTSLEATKFVEIYMEGTTQLVSDADVLKYGVEAAAQTKGFFLEMGVGMGRTLNFIAALNPTKTIYGFDSFDGLPEDWDKGDKIVQRGTFARKDPHYFPPLLNNTRVYKGLFANTLPQFRDEILKENPIAFLHIDCDSYTPTKEVFTALGQNIKQGTVIVFDELYNYPNYALHEWKALQEFLKETNYEVEFLAFNVNHEQVAVRIKQGGNN